MPSELQATRDRILNAAEDRFGQQGFSTTSLRQITELAGANLAAVNYHFGSKEALYHEVMLRRARPLNEERLRLLDEAEQLAGDQPVPLRSILDSFIRPLLQQATLEPSRSASFLRLIWRDLTDPQPFMKELLAREFNPLVTRYRDALTLALPGIPAAEIFWRMHFIMGATLYTACHQHDIDKISFGACSRGDLDGCIQRLIDFCAAGLEAFLRAPSGPRIDAQAPEASGR